MGWAGKRSGVVGVHSFVVSTLQREISASDILRKYHPSTGGPSDGGEPRGATDETSPEAVQSSSSSSSGPSGSNSEE